VQCVYGIKHIESNVEHLVHLSNGSGSGKNVLHVVFESQEVKIEFNLNPDLKISSALVKDIVGHTRNVSKEFCMAVSGKTLIM
jgi:hypothetical protein